jgi:diguanylate cyclase (GGDEF)-like protein
MDRLDHVIRSSRRYTGYLYAVLFLDMDRFKVVNDSLGHTIGDKLLIAVGQKLSNSLRPGDTVARLGGDEFAVLLENINHLTDAVEIAERIQKELSMPFSLAGYEIFSGASIGIALGSGAYERPEQIVRDADIAMYQAKAKGNSSYEIFDAKMYVSVVERL